MFHLELTVRSVVFQQYLLFIEYKKIALHWHVSSSSPTLLEFELSRNLSVAIVKETIVCSGFSIVLTNHGQRTL